MEWKPIETAPKDGSPVWVKGYNYGNKSKGEHRHFAWWDGENWIEAASESELSYIVEWMPLPAPPITLPDPTLPPINLNTIGVAK